MCCKRKNLEPIWVAPHHVQGGLTDGARGSKNGHPLGLAILGRFRDWPRPARLGSTGSKASTRSSTPPCPGSSWLGVLTPAARLTRD